MSIESSWFPEQQQSSDSEARDSRPKKDNRAAVSRFGYHSLNISRPHEGSIDLKPASNRRPVESFRPVLSEVLKAQEQEKTTAEDDDDDDQDEPRQHAVSVSSGSVDEGFIRRRMTDHEATALTDEATTTEDAAVVADTHAAHAVLEFEHGEPAEVVEPVSLNPDERAPDAAVDEESPIPVEWTPQMSQANEYAPADPNDQDETVTSAATSTAQATSAAATPPSATGGGGAPPRPPIPPPAAGAGAPNPNNYRYNFAPPLPAVNWNAAPTSGWANAANILTTRDAMEQVRTDAERRGLRRGLIAGFITGYAVKAYLANRKMRRFQQEAQWETGQLNQRVTGLQSEQYRLQEQVAAQKDMLRQHERADRIASNQQTNRFEQPAATTFNKPETKSLPPITEVLSPVQAAPEQRMFDEQGNEIILQPGWRVERSAGGYSVVLDEHNRVVHEAIQYGEGFKRDQKPEQVRDDTFAAGTAQQSSDPAGSGGTPADLFTVPSSPVTPQLDPTRELPAGYLADMQHRLPKPRNQLVATVKSPWLWAAVALLLIVYFAAALA